MTSVDLHGLVVAIALGTLISALGAGVDSLLLNRHAKYFNDLALKWWDFFDNLKIIDMPRIAAKTYLRGKDLILGSRLDFHFFVRVLILSTVLTTLAVPGGRALGLALVLWCNKLTGLSNDTLSLWEYLKIGWQWTGVGAIAYMAPVNIFFDFTITYITVFLLTIAVKRNDYVLAALVLVDILVCLILIHNIIYLADKFDGVTLVAYEGYFTALYSLIHLIHLGTCAVYHLVVSKLLFASTILLPTFVYLLIILGLFVLREGFKVFKFVSLYLFEKSSEDKKTIFAHLGVTIGLIVACGKAVAEIYKIS